LLRRPAEECAPGQILENVQAVQRRQNLTVSSELKSTLVCDVNVDIEMETGTGKTYCYIKTMFELHREYGWSKFIVVVPSIAIREGVAQSFEITAEHFLKQYGKRARWFIYNSKQLHNLESFSSDAGINVMIINGTHASMSLFGNAKPSGITPTMRKSSPSSRKSLPTASERAPNRVLQSRWLRTTTCSLPGVVSSSVKPRPSDGWTPGR
jgi:hypothetical protein